MKYYSLAMEGVPFGLRLPSLLFAQDAAQKTLAAYADIERLEIVEITLKHIMYEVRLFDPFAKLGLTL